MSLSREKRPGADGLREILGLMAGIADPQKYAARLDELEARDAAATEKTEKANALMAMAEKRSREVDGLVEAVSKREEAAAAVKAEYEAALAKLREAEAKAEGERIAKKNELRIREDAVKAREDVIGSKETDAADLMARAKTVLAEGEALRTKWQRKLEAFEALRNE